MRDVVAVHLEVATQVGAGVRAAEAVGAEHGVLHRHKGADLVGKWAHVVGGGDGRALAAFQQLGDIRLARRLRLRMQAVPALGVEAVAAQLGEARAAPDIGGHAELTIEQLGGEDRLAQDRARAHQLHAQLALLRSAGVLQQVHALDDPLGRTLRHLRVGVVFVHQGQVVILVHLFGHHPLHAVLQHHRHFVGESRVVRAAVRDVAGQQMRMAVFVLQAFAVERGAAGGRAQQEATRAHIGGLPGRVADALEAEHRIENVERQHRHVVGAVARRRGHPTSEATSLGDAFLQHLAGDIFAVEHQLVGVDRLVLLAEWRIDANLAEQTFHTEGSRLVADDRHRARADRLVAQNHVQRLHEDHRGADLAVAAALQ